MFDYKQAYLTEIELSRVNRVFDWLQLHILYRIPIRKAIHKLIGVREEDDYIDLFISYNGSEYDLQDGIALWIKDNSKEIQEELRKSLK